MLKKLSSVYAQIIIGILLVVILIMLISYINIFYGGRKQYDNIYQRATVRCFTNKALIYMANGMYDSNTDKFIESGTNDIIKFKGDCIVRLQSTNKIRDNL